MRTFVDSIRFDSIHPYGKRRRDRPLRCMISRVSDRRGYPPSSLDALRDSSLRGGPFFISATRPVSFRRRTTSLSFSLSTPFRAPVTALSPPCRAAGRCTRPFPVPQHERLTPVLELNVQRAALAPSTETMFAASSSSEKRSCTAGWISGRASVCARARAVTAWLFTKSGACAMPSCRRRPRASALKANLAVMSSLFSPTMHRHAPFFSLHTFSQEKRMSSTRVSLWFPASVFACVPSTIAVLMVISSITGFNIAGFAASPDLCLTLIP